MALLKVKTNLQSVELNLNLTDIVKAIVDSEPAGIKLFLEQFSSALKERAGDFRKMDPHRVRIQGVAGDIDSAANRLFMAD